MSRRLYTEANVRDLPAGSELVLGGGAIATPAALELAFARGIQVQWSDGSKTPGSGRSDPGDSLWQRLLSKDGEYVVRTKGGRARVFRLEDGGPVLIGEGS